MIHTVFPILNNVNEQAQNRVYGGANIGFIYSYNNKLPPFQFTTPIGNGINNVYLINNITGEQVVDLFDHIVFADWVENTFTDTGNTYIMYLGDSAFINSYIMDDGEYYLKIVVSGGSTEYRYSEVFRVNGGTRSTVPSKYWGLDFLNSKDIDDNEPICYQNNFRQKMYVPVDMKATKPRLLKDVVEMEGVEIVRTVSVQEIKRVSMLVSENIYRGLIRLPLHDTVTIINRYNTDDVSGKNIKIGDPAWKGGGAFCRIEIEYIIEVGTAKNTNINLT